MTTAEQLEKAKSGDEYSYRLLCSRFADGLYAVAMLALGRSTDAEEAVLNAFRDGFSSISRIKDEAHLRAWLSRELTKHLVATLKEYQAQGIALIPTDEFARLPSLDRIVCALKYTFGYSAREISVITGLSEETASRKLEETERKLGAGRELVFDKIEALKAPEALIVKEKPEEKPVKAASVPAKTEPEPAAPDPKPVKAIPVPETVTAPEKQPLQEPAKAVSEPEQKKSAREIDARTFIGAIMAQHIKGGDFLQLIGNTRISNSAYHEIESNPDLTKERLIELLESSSLTSEDYFKMLTAVKQRSELITRKEKIDSIKEEASLIAAERSTENVIVSGNTEPFKPIMNTALLEGISGGEELSKEKSDRQEKPEKPEKQHVPERPLRKPKPAKEEKLEELEKRFEEEKKKRAPKAKPTLADAATSAGLYSIEEIAAGKNRQLSATGPFSPIVNTAVLDDLSGGEEAPEEDKKLPEPPKPRRAEPIYEEPKRPEPKVSAPEPVEARQPEPVLFEQKHPMPKAAEPARAKPKSYETTIPEPDLSDEMSFEPELPDNDEDIEVERKYKGKEFFIDDDVYYKGVNAGKMAFCAVCAVLLFAGSFAVRYFNTGNFLPSASAEAAVTEPPEEPKPEIISDAGLLAAMSEMKTRVQHNYTEYFRSDGKPYSETLSTEFCESEKTLFLRSDNMIQAVTLSDDPKISAELEISPDELLGFRSSGDRFYVVYYSPKDNRVTVETYDPAFQPADMYSQDGRFVNIKTDGSTFTLVTAISPDAEKSALPAYSLNDSEKKLTFEDFLTPDGAVCGGITVIGSVSGGEARANAILGGYDSYASFEGDRLIILLPDWNSTHVIAYRMIGTAAELISSEKIAGECFGADCLDYDSGRAVTYDSANGWVNVVKKSGEENSVSEGFAAGERLCSASFTDDRVYVITKKQDGTAMLYCADTTREVPEAAAADPNAVYTDKLAAFGDSLIGLSVDTDESGERTALRLAVYGYEGGLVPLRSALIKVDSNTSEEYARYLSGDAENDPLKIASDEKGTLAAVSCVYFDGISKIERYIVFSDNGAALEVKADRLMYDVQTDRRYLAIRGDTLFIVTDRGIYTMDIADKAE